MNPYEALSLPASASEDDVIKTAARLGTDAAREAARVLTASAEARELHGWLTPPGAGEAGADVERFVAAHRRPPAGEPLSVPPLDEAEVRDLIRAAVAEQHRPGPEPLSAVAAGETAEEIGRQTAEGLWLSLLHDPRG